MNQCDVFVQPAGGCAVLCGKNLSVEHYIQTFQPNVFLPAMLIGTIDFYHFIPHSVTLTLTGGHKVSTKLSCWLHFLTHFSTHQHRFDLMLE